MHDREKYRVKHYTSADSTYALGLKVTVFPAFQLDGGIEFDARLELPGPGMILFHHRGAGDAKEAREAVCIHIERLIESLTQMKDSLRAANEGSAVSE